MLIKSRSSFISPNFRTRILYSKSCLNIDISFFFFFLLLSLRVFPKCLCIFFESKKFPTYEKSRDIRDKFQSSKEYRRICIFRRNLDFRGNTNGWIDLQEFPEFFYTMGIGMENGENWNGDEIKKKKKEKGRKGIEVSRIINIYI